MVTGTLSPLCHLSLCSIEGWNLCSTPQAWTLRLNHAACDGRQRHTGHQAMLKMYGGHLMASNSMLKIFSFSFFFVLSARRSWLLSGACTWRVQSPSRLLYAIDWRSNEFLVDVPMWSMTADFNTTRHYVWLLTFSPHPLPCFSVVF